jgi:hypothetical protein
MGITFHPRTEIPDRGEPIWRYIELTQLIGLLERRSLFFSRADNFEDSHEGAVPKLTRERREEALRGIDDYLVEQFIPSITGSFRQFTYMNCWHHRDTESATMWGAYSDSGVPICIESDVGRLIDAIERGGTSEDVYLHKVEYKDFDDFDIPNWNPINIDDYLPPYLYKRNEFRSEREFRAIIQHQPSGAFMQTHNGPEAYFGDDQQEIGLESEIPEGGIHIPVNLGILISKIHIGENVPDWKCEIIEDTVEYHLSDEPYSISVVQSSIHDDEVLY